jgi:hypothetical protein
MSAPRQISLDEPESILRWIATSPSEVDLDEIDLAEVWGLVALGTLARKERELLHPKKTVGRTGGSRFAFALGFRDLSQGISPREPGEAGRTVKLQRIGAGQFSEIEPMASRISHLLIPDSSLADTELTIRYVLVELLRNAVQHSKDPLGAVVAAQFNERVGRPPVVQIAVADAGMGIFQSLKPKHPDLETSVAALEKSLWPHISGTFEQGLTGAPLASNAGLGLFFISEMAKMQLGRLLLASKGAALLLEGGDGPDDHRIRFLEPSGLGFPGTLVAFELPVGEVKNYAGLIEHIQQVAKERQPKRELHHWFTFTAPPAGTSPFLVSYTSENTQAARTFAEEQIEPRLYRRDPVALDFRNLEICTQSYLHALLYSPLRLAWARQSPIFVVNANPAVRSGLLFLESYALGG